MNILKIFIIILLVVGCSEIEEYRNLRNIDKVKDGDNMLEVVAKMEGEPYKWIIPDTIYLHQQKVVNLTTMIYDTPRGSSSKIHIHFKDCHVLHVYYD